MLLHGWTQGLRRLHFKTGVFLLDYYESRPSRYVVPTGAEALRSRGGRIQANANAMDEFLGIIPTWYILKLVTASLYFAYVS